MRFGGCEVWVGGVEGGRGRIAMRSSGGLVKRRKDVKMKGSLTAHQEKLGIQFPA